MSDFGPPPDVWVPFQLNPQTTDQGHYFRAAGRLVPGITVEQAQARLKLSTAAYERKFPNALGRDVTFSAQRLEDALVADVWAR
jgi:putative ABC transport system permease protein